MAWNGQGFRAKIGVCKDCADREIGCHGTCEKYITAKKGWDEERSKIYAERSKTIEYDTFRFDAVCKRKVIRDKKARMKHRS